MRGNQLTVHDDVVSLPEERLVLEQRLRDGSGVFPILPLGPGLSEVDAVPQLFGSKRVVGKDEIITGIGNGGRVVVGIREDHDIVRLALPDEEMVGSLVAQTQ